MGVSYTQLRDMQNDLSKTILREREMAVQEERKRLQNELQKIPYLEEQINLRDVDTI